MDEVRVWEVASGGNLNEAHRSKLDKEERIEEWIARDISVLDPDLLVIGEQVETDFGKFIDLLCIDSDGDLVIVQLKRDKTPREVTAQALDYASWVKDLSRDRVQAIAKAYFAKIGDQKTLESAFTGKFGDQLPEVINEHHAMRVVAAEIDDSTERIIRYLSDTYGVDINAVRFQFFEADGRQLLVRTFTVAPEEAETNIHKTPGKRRSPATLEELREIAVEKGVGRLYDLSSEMLVKYFGKGKTTQNNLMFNATFPDGSKKVLLSLVPRESDLDHGLRYQMYSKRLAQLLGIQEDIVKAHLPNGSEPWGYYAGAPPDMQGCAGYIKSEDDLRKIEELLTERIQALSGDQTSS